MPDPRPAADPVDHRRPPCAPRLAATPTTAARRRSLAVAAGLAGALHVAAAAGLLADPPARPPPGEATATGWAMARIVPLADRPAAPAEAAVPPGPPVATTTAAADEAAADDAARAPTPVAGAVQGPRSTPPPPGVLPSRPRVTHALAEGRSSVALAAPTAGSDPGVGPGLDLDPTPAPEASPPSQPTAARVATAMPPATPADRTDSPSGPHPADRPEPAADSGTERLLDPPITVAMADSQRPPATAATPAAPAAGAARAPAADAGPVPAPAVPLYPVRLPAARTLAYDLTRGVFSGTGELRWEPAAGGRYQARMEGRIAGFLILQWTSQGGIDRTGLAPVRYTDRRRNGSEFAANFVREQGVVRYSGPGVVHALPAAGQDRLSWMVQIAGIVQARATPPAAGETLQLWVTGARGDADVWTFRSLGTVDVAAGGRLLRTVAFAREPREPHDTRVEVWLDPGRDHLPVRARLGSARGDDTLELVLRP